MFIKRLFILLGMYTGISLYAQNPLYSFPDHFDKTYYSYGHCTPGADCMADRIILKINSDYRSFCDVSSIHIQPVMQVLNSIKLTSLSKIYPHHTPPAQTKDAYGRTFVDLSLIYEVIFDGSTDVRKIITELNALDAVEYAQPRFIEQPAYTPNDPAAASIQWYLNKIRAKQAWDLDTGNISVVVGIVDGGTNFTHPDLQTNIAYSSTEPVDGLDNDNDGFIDNYRGWDVGDADNYPQYIGAHNSAHGTSMCGLAAATPNNGIGVAGVGYRIGYLPVKMVHSTYGWIAGYEGVVYAADHGVVAINCSWGSNNPGPYGQDVVNYAAINRGCLMIAAAGNSNNTVPFYPASYENVICVGGTDSNDVKSANSSYYNMVDMVSPGQLLYEPYAAGYANGSGTSDATAITTGAAGLIQSYHSTYTPIQIGAILRQTTSRIDSIPGNAAYLNRQGSGRLDMYKALTATFKPYPEFTERIYSDGNDDVFTVGDTVTLAGNILNLLAPAGASLKASITDNSPYVQWIDSVVNIGAVGTLSYANINANPFRFVILPGAPVNQSVLLKVVFEETDTLNTQYFSVNINRDYYHVTINKLNTTVTSRGRIGFADNATVNGLGYRMQGAENNLLGLYFNPMGLFLSRSSSFVSDQTLSATMGPCCPFANDNDMQALKNIMVYHHTPLADLEVVSEFTDSAAGVGATGLKVKQKVYGWSDTLNDQFLLLEYQFKNNSGASLGPWLAGLYADFDMPDSLLWNVNSSIARFDTLAQAGIVYSALPRYYVGYKMLYAPGQTKYYANNSDGSGGTINVYNGFTSAEKYTMMNPSVPSNISQVSDVAQYLGVSFDSLSTDGCAMMYMALLIGNSLTDIQQQATLAQAKFNTAFNIWTGNGGDQNWHNAANWSQMAVPDFNDHVIIPDTRAANGWWPVISTADGLVKNIEIRCGGRLEVDPGFRLRVGN